MNADSWLLSHRGPNYQCHSTTQPLQKRNEDCSPPHITAPVVVAEVIYEAVTDGTDRLRYTAAEDAAEMLANRTATGDEEFLAGMKKQFGVSTTSN